MDDEEQIGQGMADQILDLFSGHASKSFMEGSLSRNNRGKCKGHATCYMLHANIISLSNTALQDRGHANTQCTHPKVHDPP